MVAACKARGSDLRVHFKVRILEFNGAHDLGMHLGNSGLDGGVIELGRE